MTLIEQDGIVGKICSKCKEWKPIEEYHAKKEARDGRRSACKVCTNAANKAHADRNRDYERMRQQMYYAKNRGAIRAKRALYAEHSREIVREWHRRNRERQKVWQQKYHLRRPDVRKRAHSKYYASHKEMYLAKYHLRRARLRAALGQFTAAEWRSLKARYNYTCLRCGQREPEIKLTPDHIVPLVKGGANSIDNIQPLCANCNKSKQDKIIDYRPPPQ